MFPTKYLSHLVVIVLVAGATPTGTAYALDQKSGRLAVVVRAEALVQIPDTVAGVVQPSETGLTQVARFDIPVAIKIRLAPNVAATLAIESMTGPAESTSFSSGVVQVNGLAVPLSSMAPATASIAASGQHLLAISVTLQGNTPIQSGMLPIRMTLRSLDGAIDWTGTVQLRWNSPTE